MSTPELEALRARVAELESELESARVPRRQVQRSPWLTVTAAVLITLACVLAPLSVAAVWASTQVSDTERYVETVAPLAEDPAIQRAVADEVTRVVLEYVDVEGLTAQTLDALAQLDLPPRVQAALPALAGPITNGVESFTRSEVRKLIASPAFANLWEQANRVAHQQVVILLEGQQGGVLSAQDGTVTLNLAPVIERVKDRLVARGFTLAENIPTVDRSFVLVESDAVTRAQGVYRLLNTLGVWLPFIALAMLVVGVVLARDHRQALLRGSLGVVGAILLTGVALAVARILYVDAVPAEVLPREAHGTVFDTLVRFLRSSLRTTAVLALVVALAAFFAGPATAAVRTRAVLQGGIARARGGAEAAGWQTGRVGTWTYRHRRALRIGAAVLAGLVLTFWDRPSVAVVVTTALLLLVAVGLIELIGRPVAVQPAAAAEEAGPPPVPRQAQRRPSAYEPVPPAGTTGATATEREETPHG